ncbi:MAG: glycine cleavage system protein GcvH [Clostridiaceae bacterium]|jgi:glycine cleavage system H protein|nr:glycine cleavage system protein GcvH [Clostridiaceae bacterium]
MIPKNLYYTKEHEWVKVTDEGLVVGITHYAQEQLGDIVYVELPEVGSEFNAQDAASVVESVKTASDIYMPVKGVIKAVNRELEDRPELINEDCYTNYIFIIDAEDADLSGLLSADEYAEYLKELGE